MYLMVCAGQHPRLFIIQLHQKNIGNIQLILYVFSIDGVNKKESYLSEHLYNKYLAVKDILKGSHTQKIRWNMAH